jgi:hypothetical protein
VRRATEVHFGGTLPEGVTGTAHWFINTRWVSQWHRSHDLSQCHTQRRLFIHTRQVWHARFSLSWNCYLTTSPVTEPYHRWPRHSICSNIRSNVTSPPTQWQIYERHRLTKILRKTSLCLTNQALRHEGVRRSGCIDPQFLDLGTSWRWVVSFMPPAALSPGRVSPVPIGYEAGWALEPVWMLQRSENSWLYRDSNSDPSAVQSVASRHTGCAIPARKNTTYASLFPPPELHVQPIVTVLLPKHLLCKVVPVLMKAYGGVDV